MKIKETFVVLVAVMLLVCGVGPVDTSAQSPGDLIVNKVDENGDPLGGACFAVHEDAGEGQRGAFIVQQCDYEDGLQNGRFVFTGLAPGSYVLQEFHAPDGYITGAQRQVTITANEPTIVNFPNTPGGSNITIHKVDAGTGELLIGACFVVIQDDGGDPRFAPHQEGRCDNSDGSDNGITPFTGLPGGSYYLWERVAPSGYQASDVYIPFSVDGSTSETITVENVQTTPIDALIATIIEIIKEILASQTA